jgi:hypothetical protein
MKIYNVDICANVRVTIGGVKAKDHKAAMKQADAAVDLKALFATVHIPAPALNSLPIAAVEFSCIDHYWLSPVDATNRYLEGKGYDAGKNPFFDSEEEEEEHYNQETLRDLREHGETYTPPTEAELTRSAEEIKLHAHMELIEIAERERRGLELTKNQKIRLEMIADSERWERKELERLRKAKITFLPHWRRKGRKKPDSV